MLAIVEACGRQYQLEAGRFIDIDLSDYEPGQEFVFDKVLMLVDGKSSTVGTPHIEGAKVTGKVLSHGKGSKIIVYKMRPKKRTRKKQGHRQEFTRVLIDRIELNDKVLAKGGDSSSASVEGASSTKRSKKPVNKEANSVTPKKARKIKETKVA
jgi:large subunit ribosomal protein L21